MNQQELKEFLDFKADYYENPDFIQTDPIQLVHAYNEKADREIVGLLMATIAWGNRKAIIASGNKLRDLMGNSPIDFVMNGKPENIQFVHRTFNGVDLAAFLRSLNHIYRNLGSLEQAFQTDNTNPGAMERIAAFRDHFLANEFPDRTRKHVADPLRNSSAKRLNMFLRWMVRSEHKGVDFGLWKSISTSELQLPLDVHTGNISRKLGLLDRTQNDWKSVEILGEKLREFDPEDPCKYDFALFGLGAFEGF